MYLKKTRIIGKAFPRAKLCEEALLFLQDLRSNSIWNDEESVVLYAIRGGHIESVGGGMRVVHGSERVRRGGENNTVVAMRVHSSRN